MLVYQIKYQQNKLRFEVEKNHKVATIILECKMKIWHRKNVLGTFLCQYIQSLVSRTEINWASNKLNKIIFINEYCLFLFKIHENFQKKLFYTCTKSNI